MTEFRRRQLLHGLDPARLSGLEIGPLADPIVRREDGRVIYVDHLDAAGLRAKYAGGEVDPAAIVEVDALWSDRPLRETIGGGTVDYVIASHVAEHVPDLVTWLQEVEGVLATDGELRLALPDMRYSFDHFRQPTRFSDLIAAWLVRARRPQIPQILDFALNFAPGVDGPATDAGLFDPASTPRHYCFLGALDLAKRALADPAHYEDVHCWVFDAAHFARLMLELHAAGLLRMECSHFVDTVPEHCYEFYVFMKPCHDEARIVESWERVRSCASPRYLGRAAARWAEDRVVAIENSTSWRVTAPLRALARWVGR